MGRIGLSILNLIRFSCKLCSFSYICQRISSKKCDEIQKIMVVDVELNLCHELTDIFLESLLKQIEQTLNFRL